jgi:response regulator RpfG family c-di-GMP phosphodiesterase
MLPACDSGYDVLQAEDAGCAKRLFAESEEEIDLLLCYAVLPDENGVDLAGLLCGISPGLRLLLVSGYPLPTLRGLDEELIVHFLSKPYSSTLLISEIQLALRSEVFHGSLRTDRGGA